MFVRPHLHRLAPALVAIAIFVAGCDAGAVSTDRQPEYHHLARAHAIDAEPGYAIQREFAGLVAPRQTTELAFELDGEVAALHVDEGDRVESGQLLAELDTRLLDAQRDNLAASKRDLEARLDLNATSRARQEALQERGFAADQRIDELEAERRSLVAQLQRVAADIEANSTRLDQARMVAPFAGAVSRRLVDEGAVVNSGSPVLALLEESALEARVGIPVRMVGDITVGDSLPVRVAGDSVTATVLAIGSDVTRATLTVPVRLALPDTRRVVPGDQAYLVLPERVDERGFWVPMTALTDGIRGLWNVYVMVPEPESAAPDKLYRLEARDVRVLWADEDRAYVAGALAAGDLVVEAGLHRLVPGQRVRRESPVS